MRTIPVEGFEAVSRRSSRNWHDETKSSYTEPIEARPDKHSEHQGLSYSPTDFRASFDQAQQGSVGTLSIPPEPCAPSSLRVPAALNSPVPSESVLLRCDELLMYSVRPRKCAERCGLSLRRA